tara:strand:+ start:679 stop:1212 length:534 start_codon:yes stop_codon:yes gene_type:complete
MYDYFTSSKPVRKIETYRVCDTCHNQKETTIEFKKLSDSREFTSTCKACLQTIKGTTIKRPSRQSALSKAVNVQLYNSHKRMLDEALAQDVEETCPLKLRAMFPYFTDKQVTNMARLNEKWNAANDFLIEEQSAYLDPSSRPVGGIPYDEELFAVREFDVDSEETLIKSQQVDIDDQ